MPSYSETAVASMSLHVMDDAPVKVVTSHNLGTPTLTIEAGMSDVALFFWGPEAPAKITAIRAGCDALLAELAGLAIEGKGR